MFGSGWMLDSHTILMMILLVVAVIYLIQNSNNNDSGSESNQLVPVKKRKSSKKETTENFEDSKKTPVKFTMYYVPWCPHCRTSKPQWKKLEEYAKENLPWATVESVDCEKNPSEAQKNDIEYF